jgi:6-phosphogluconolactonase
MHKWHVYPEFDDASKSAADFIAGNIEKKLQENDICRVILPGGNTPAICLSYLSEKELPWDKVHWYLGDERCYPRDHAERNDVMLEKYLWSRISSTNVNNIPAELGAEEAAEVYREVINSVNSFDIAFLGLGEDGHTASLFPDNEALNDIRSVIPVYNSPKAPEDRVSLSLNTLRKAECRVVLTGGTAKADVISRIKRGEQLPINRLGDINWYVDEAALSETTL